MLAECQAFATVAVKDLAAARRFYQDTLGLKQVNGESDEAVSYAVGASKLVVYRSQYAGTNKATTVTWAVGGELEHIIQALKAKGVTFEHYDIPNAKRDGDIYVTDTLRVAWFTDSEGNIHNLNDG